MPARLHVAHTWPSGEQTDVYVQVDTSYPDALNEGRKTAVDTFRGICDILDQLQPLDIDDDQDSS